MKWKKYDAFFCGWATEMSICVYLVSFVLLFIAKVQSNLKCVYNSRLVYWTRRFFLVDEFRIKNNNDDRHFSSREEERKRNQSSSENRLNIQNKNFACMGRSKPNRAEIKVKVTGMLSSVSHTRLYVHIHSIILNYRHKNLQENRNKRHDNKMRSK